MEAGTKICISVLSIGAAILNLKNIFLDAVTRIPTVS